jgi:crotonobetainyl-CoA:carnitine CoA-transferase CaiB-like acyl-CoA transferase
VDIPHPAIPAFRMVRAPIRIDGQGMAAMRPPPALDQHRAEILSGLRTADSPEKDPP